MPKAPTTSIQIQATQAPGVQEPRQVVYLHVAGYRFELDAPSGVKACAIAIEVARALGLKVDE